MQGQLHAVVNAARNACGDSLDAVYLCGSAASGGVKPQSDLDIIVVVDRPMTDGERQTLLAHLLQTSRRLGMQHNQRPIELAVFSRGELADLSDPPRAEFFYGEWMRPAFEAGLKPAAAQKPGFSLLLAQARERAQTLVGPSADRVLPDIPNETIAAAIIETLPTLATALRGNERNVLLTLARMVVTLETGTFIPKDVAAQRLAERLPPPEAGLLDMARRGYLGEVRDRWDGLQVETAALAATLASQIEALAEIYDQSHTMRM